MLAKFQYSFDLISGKVYDKRNLLLLPLIFVISTREESIQLGNLRPETIYCPEKVYHFLFSYIYLLRCNGLTYFPATQQNFPLLNLFCFWSGKFVVRGNYLFVCRESSVILEPSVSDCCWQLQTINISHFIRSRQPAIEFSNSRQMFKHKKLNFAHLTDLKSILGAIGSFVGIVWERHTKLFRERKESFRVEKLFVQRNSCSSENLLLLSPQSDRGQVVVQEFVPENLFTMSVHLE